MTTEEFKNRVKAEMSGKEFLPLWEIGRINHGNVNISAILKFVNSVVEAKPTGRADLYLLILLSLEHGYNMKKYIESSESISPIIHDAVKNFELNYTLDGLSATMKKTAVTPSRLKMISPDLVLVALSTENLERPLPYKTVESAFGLKDGLSYPKILCDISVASLIPMNTLNICPKEFVYSSLMCVFGYALIETVTFNSRSPSLNDQVKKIVTLLIVSWKGQHISHIKKKRAFARKFSLLNLVELQKIADLVELYCKKNNFESPLEDIKIYTR